MKPLLNSWFKLFQSTREIYNIWVDDIWNVEDTCFQIGVFSKAKIVIPRANKNNYMPQLGDKSWASILKMVNTGRKILLPFLIFKKNTHYLQ